MTDEVIIDIGALYKASEAVALLDLLWSFAHVSIGECSVETIRAHSMTQWTLVRSYSRVSSSNEKFSDDTHFICCKHGPNLPVL